MDEGSNLSIEIPPTKVVVDRLSSIKSEERLLRKLLRIAISRDKSVEVASPKESEGVQCS